MSAFGGKADVIQGMAEGPLIAISGHRGSAAFTSGCSQELNYTSVLEVRNSACRRAGGLSIMGATQRKRLQFLRALIATVSQTDRTQPGNWII